MFEIIENRWRGNIIEGRGIKLFFFWDIFSLCFKMRVVVKFFIWKWVFFIVYIFVSDSNYSKLIDFMEVWRGKCYCCYGGGNMYCCISIIFFFNVLFLNNLLFSIDYFIKLVDVGMWYCKFLLDVIKMLKKKCCDRKKFGGKFVEDLGGKFVL